MAISDQHAEIPDPRQQSRARQERKHRQGPRTATTRRHPVEQAPAHGRIDADVDAVLDEIDEVLEENAEEFVRSFVQKGGE